MSGTQEKSITEGPDGPAYEVINPSGCGPFVLVCEHAAKLIPAEMNGLGLDAAAAESHIAWDPGALTVARRLSELLDVPLVATRYSRLIYDCNRAQGAPDAVPARSETYEIPGNTGLSQADLDERFQTYYLPFEEAVRDVIERRVDRGETPAIVTMHSFTPTYFGVERPVELGVLHDADTRLADAFVADGQALTGYRTERNQPYGPGDGVTHTLKTHALARGLPNAMLEIRNDLLADDEACHRCAGVLAQLLQRGLTSMDRAACTVETSAGV